MKKIIKYALTIALLPLLFTSCEKSYQCECGGSVVEVKATSYGEAVQECSQIGNGSCIIIDSYVWY